VSDPQSVEEWLMLVEQHEESARVLCDNLKTTAQGYFHCGIAVECMLKAYIMKKERWNSFPSREVSRKLTIGDIYTHDVRKLKKIAGIIVNETDDNAAEWHVVEAWDRNEGYSPKHMPRKQANEFYETVFGKNGVVTWLRKTLK
jgi:hypothetical protein